MNNVDEKLGGIITTLNSSPDVLASAFFLRDGLLLNYDVLAEDRSSSDLLNIMYYAARTAIDKARHGSIEDVVIAGNKDKAFVRWINPRAMLVVIASPQAETNLILSFIDSISSEASAILIEPAQEAAPEKKTPFAKKNKIACIQVSVRDASGMPVEGCWVEVYKDRKRVQEDITTQSGIASFKLLTGEYKLVVRKEGYDSYDEEISMDNEFMAQSVTLKSPGENKNGE